MTYVRARNPKSLRIAVSPPYRPDPLIYRISASGKEFET